MKEVEEVALVQVILEMGCVLVWGVRMGGVGRGGWRIAEREVVRLGLMRVLLWRSSVGGMFRHVCVSYMQSGFIYVPVHAPAFYTMHTLEYHTMGWLRIVGSFKLYVTFAKETYKRDYILQRRPIV